MNPGLLPVAAGLLAFAAIALYAAVTGRLIRRAPRTARRQAEEQPPAEDTDRALLGILAATWDTDHPPKGRP